MAETRDWAGYLGTAWAETINEMDVQLAPVLTHALAALDARPGERVVDLGCGGGATTVKIAEAVGAEGCALGLDVSPSLAAIAKRRGAHLPQMTVVAADAAAHDFAGRTFDALFSRFGCMFFDEPAVAFERLRAALIPGGRATLAVWAEPKKNPWAMVPASAGNDILGPAEKLPPGAPGPFGWAMPEIFEPILAEAGFAEVRHTEKRIEMVSGFGGAPDPIDRAIALAERLGPLARRLKDAPEGTAERVRPILREKIAPFLRGDRVVFPGAVRIVTARA